MGREELLDRVGIRCCGCCVGVRGVKGGGRGRFKGVLRVGEGGIEGGASRYYWKLSCN